jgi:hypothetical protein
MIGLLIEHKTNYVNRCSVADSHLMHKATIMRATEVNKKSIRNTVSNVW